MAGLGGGHILGGSIRIFYQEYFHVGESVDESSAYVSGFYTWAYSLLFWEAVVDKAWAGIGFGGCPTPLGYRSCFSSS